MGLTQKSTGINANDSQTEIYHNCKRVALAGNPNVGKSTLFNMLTGMNQHTGNWPGKTVAVATGLYKGKSQNYAVVDLPGTYSLLAHSPEEEIARNYLLTENPDCVVAVCDATCLERNLSLVLQISEITPKVVVCINLIDEAKKKNIHINTKKLSQCLGLPVVTTVATSKKTLNTLPKAIDKAVTEQYMDCAKPIYPTAVYEAAILIAERLSGICPNIPNKQWLSLRLLDEAFVSDSDDIIPHVCRSDEKLQQCIDDARAFLAQQGIDSHSLHDIIVSAPIKTAEQIYSQCVTGRGGYSIRDKRIDSIVTSKVWGFPSMVLLLMFILWLTISAANVPSQILSRLVFFIEQKLLDLMNHIGAPPMVTSAIVFGVYRTLGWVVSVMLPPMAVFFPLFTILEDIGYLPRIAYNLDLPFKKCNACGKQALTMCMGLGCNAAGVVGCRIVDSPRERLLAILTNSFVPCNGKFPILISLITMFFAAGSGIMGNIWCALMLTAVLTLCIGATLGMTRLLSGTLLKGVPSSYALEMPPYRKPKFADIVVRSIFDRTLFVLGRAVSVAAPAGLVIWLMANITPGGSSLLAICAHFLEPVGRLMGLDGVILMAFILGTPANEIVIPIMLMAYMSQSTIAETGALDIVRQILIQNGWTATTALCMIVFSVFHWPCATTLLTIKKETGSLKLTGIAAALPTLLGMIVCIILNTITS
ncbi:MAG: ferrous iron transport protein B [Clostridia bacterium]|nr:ferrous iron transport protein B [Clostridia bacterium]